MEPNFKVTFAFFRTRGSYEQCTGSKKKRKRQLHLLSELTLRVRLGTTYLAKTKNFLLKVYKKKG